LRHALEAAAEGEVAEAEIERVTARSRLWAHASLVRAIPASGAA
jgi:hypothetical protein